MGDFEPWVAPQDWGVGGRVHTLIQQRLIVSPPNIHRNMNLPAQLTHLILSFYRENPYELQQLQLLHTCKLSRRWGILRIECDEQQIANRIVGAIAALREPLNQLRLAHQISILVKGAIVLSLPVSSSKLKL